MTIAMLTASAGRKPSRSGTEQGSGSGHEGQYYASPSCATDIFLRPRYYFIDAPLGIRHSEAGKGSHKANQIGAIVGRDATVT
jgi:hypothetical protein